MKQHEVIEALRACPILSLPAATARTAEYASLAGEDTTVVWKDAEAMLDDLAWEIREARAELKHLRTHAHDWNDENYCNVCGADGRA